MPATHAFRDQPAAALLLVGLGKHRHHFEMSGSISSSNTIWGFPSFLVNPEPWVPIM